MKIDPETEISKIIDDQQITAGQSRVPYGQIETQSV